LSLIPDGYFVKRSGSTFIGVNISSITSYTKSETDSLLLLKLSRLDSNKYGYYASYNLLKTTYTTSAGMNILLGAKLDTANAGYLKRLQWDLAYSWGNHALANYLNSSSSLDPSKVSQTSSYRFVTDTEKGTWNGKQSALGFTPLNVDSGYTKSQTYTRTEINNLLSAKQDTLISGTNIKTINGNSILGSGDLVVSGGGTIDTVNTIATHNWSNNRFALSSALSSYLLRSDSLSKWVSLTQFNSGLSLKVN